MSLTLRPRWTWPTSFAAPDTYRTIRTDATSGRPNTAASDAWLNRRVAQRPFGLYLGSVLNGHPRCSPGQYASHVLTVLGTSAGGRRVEGGNGLTGVAQRPSRTGARTPYRARPPSCRLGTLLTGEAPECLVVVAAVAVVDVASAGSPHFPVFAKRAGTGRDRLRLLARPPAKTLRKLPLCRRGTRHAPSRCSRAAGRRRQHRHPASRSGTDDRCGTTSRPRGRSPARWAPDLQLWFAGAGPGDRD